MSITGRSPRWSLPRTSPTSAVTSAARTPSRRRGGRTRPQAPARPNVVIVVLDDTGFAHFGCYGSEHRRRRTSTRWPPAACATPTSTRPRCARRPGPALLTGRNHHAVGMRGDLQLRHRLPQHARRTSPTHAATVAEVLRDEGYATFAVGKWHLAPMEECSAAGPYTNWPLQRGFDRFYGFLEGETDQFHPELIYDNHRVDPPRPARGRLPPVARTSSTRSTGIDPRPAPRIRPDRPFFLYLAFGATHAPHQAPAELPGEVPRPVRRGLGRRPRALVRPPAGDGHHPAGHRAGAAQPRRRAWDRPDARTSKRSPPGCRRPSPPSSITPTPRSAGSIDSLERARPARQHAASSCCPTTAPARRAARSACCDEMKFFNGMRENADEAVEPARRHRRAAQPLQLPVGLGAGRQHAASSGTSRTPTTAASTSR